MSDSETDEIGTTQLMQVEQLSRIAILEEAEEENEIELKPSQDELELQEQTEEIPPIIQLVNGNSGMLILRRKLREMIPEQ